jgi:2'-5' RNA ligase
MAKSINPAQVCFDFAERPIVAGTSAIRQTLFFALVPDDKTAERAFRLGCDLYRQHDLAVEPRPLPLLHMSLCGIGEIAKLPDAAIDLALRAAESVGAAAFAMNLDQIFTFKQRQHPLVLCAEEGNDAFRMLHIRLGLALRNSGPRVPIQRRLQPHMTLVYGRKPITKVKLARPIALMATEFALIRSPHGEGRHEYLGRWPLRQDGPLSRFAPRAGLADQPGQEIHGAADGR